MKRKELEKLPVLRATTAMLKQAENEPNSTAKRNRRKARNGIDLIEHNFLIVPPDKEVHPRQSPALHRPVDLHRRLAEKL